MTLENFLSVLCVNKTHLITILTHDENVLYYIEGKELNFTKTAYFDPILKCTVYIGTSVLDKQVTNWTCYDGRIIIYIKEK